MDDGGCHTSLPSERTHSLKVAAAVGETPETAKLHKEQDGFVTK